MNQPNEDLMPDDLLTEDPSKQDYEIGRILKDQAEILSQKTQGKVCGEVDLRFGLDRQLQHAFYLVAPHLDDYRYLFFYVQHGLDEYPATIFVDKPVTVENEAALKDALREIFASVKFRRLVAAMSTNL